MFLTLRGDRKGREGIGIDSHQVLDCLRLSISAKCTVLDEDDMLGHLTEYLTQELLITFRIEASLLQTLIEELFREEVNGAEDLVSFTLSYGFHHKLLSNWSPSVAQGAPEGKTDLILEEHHGAFLFGQAQDMWSGLC